MEYWSIEKRHQTLSQYSNTPVLQFSLPQMHPFDQLQSWVASQLTNEFIIHWTFKKDDSLAHFVRVHRDNGDYNTRRTL
jgi:hypothetical protein